MKEYKNPALTVDSIIVSDDKVVLIKRLNDPYKDSWALPGGFVEYGECVEDATIREAKEETSLDVSIEELVGVYSDPNRDPRGHTVSVVYKCSIVGGQLDSNSDAKDAKFFTVDEIKKINLAFDHESILKDAKILDK